MKHENQVAEVSQEYFAGKNSFPIPYGYIHTEVGVIPADWDVQKFTEVTNLITCGIAATPKYVAENFGYPFLSSTNVKAGRIVWHDYKHITAELHRRLYKNNPPLKGDVLYSRVGTIGEAAVIQENFEFSIYVSLTLIKPKKFILDSFYLAQLLNSKPYKARAAEQVYLGGGVGNLNVDVVRNYPIPLPSLKEQTAIANALSDVDALINELEKLIAKKQAIKAATMQKLLTGRTRLPQFALREDGTPKGCKQSELGEIPEDWNVYRIGDFCSSYSGGTPPTSIKSYYGGEIPWITSSDLNKSYISSVEGRITPDGMTNSSAKSVTKGTFLIALYGATAGVCAISGLDGAINQAVLAVIPKKGNSEFLYYWFSQNKDDLIETYTQGGQPNLSGDIIRSILLALPSESEQTAIATILSDIDDEIQTLHQHLAKTRDIKQGMMQELLTGKTRLIRGDLEMVGEA